MSVIDTFSNIVADEWDNKSNYFQRVIGNDNKILDIIFNNSNPASILDVGCGTGKLARALNSSGFAGHYLGIDPSSDMITQCRNKNTGGVFQFKKSFIDGLHESDKYDVIVFKQVMHHLERPRETLISALKHLNEGGKIYIMSPSEFFAKEIIPFCAVRDDLGRTNSKYWDSLVCDTGLKIDHSNIIKAHAYFNGLFDLFKYLKAIGALQKSFGYRPYSDFDILDDVFEKYGSLFSKTKGIEVDLSYRYLTLSSSCMNDYDKKLSTSFDKWAHKYDADAEMKIINRGYDYDDLALKVGNHIAEVSQSCITTEIGTGPGTLGRRVALNRNVFEIHGVDISKKMLFLAESTKAYTSLSNAAADKFKYKANTQCVFSSFALHSVESLERLVSNVIAETEAVRIIVVDLYPESNEVLEGSRAHSEKHEFGAPENYKTIQEFNQTIKDMGLKISHQERLGIKKDYDHWLSVVELR